MQDPYKITEPTVISFSGGRTSAYLLWRVLQSNNGLPDDAIVCFANTGKEEEATLQFVKDCSDKWNVPITWLEYVWDEEPSKRFKVVDFETASRNGEPFLEYINNASALPNPVTRACTGHLKVRVIDKYMKSIGWKHNENMDWMGIRADEPRRAAKVDVSRVPLFVDGIIKQDITKFWSKQNFDLALPNMNGVTMHGNCDLCFLKPTYQIVSLIKEKPSRADWWIRVEKIAEINKTMQQDGARFRKDRPSYNKLKKFATSQQDMFDKDEEAIPCFCGD